MAELVLPTGVLQADADGPLRVTLRCPRAERHAQRGWFDRLRGAGLPWLTLPEQITDTPFGLALDYPSALRGSTSAVGRAAEWHADVAAALPHALALARFTLTAAADLARQRVDGVALFPPLVRSLPGDPVPWRLLAVPLGTATLADWAKADPDAWAWVSPAGLLRGEPADPVHTLGGALHLGLTGSLFADSLGQHERFARLLRGRVGMPARLETSLRTAVPTRCRSDADALRQLALDCLDPRPARRPSAEVARTRFDELERQLTLDRLVRYWEADNRPDVANRLRRSVAEVQIPKVDGGDDKDKRDWSEKARELLQRGDMKAAQAAAWNAVFAEGPQQVDLYLGVVQTAGARSADRAEVAAALARLEQAFPPQQLGEACSLRIAHIRTRYLGATETDVAPLLRATEREWTRAVSLLLRAGLHVRTGGGHAETSRLCAEGGAIFARMPQGGGDAGKYARGYLSVIDGIAHIGFVAAGGPPAYYSDALTRFGTALQLAAEVPALDLSRAAVRWLNWLGWLAGLNPSPATNTIGKAVDALLHVYGGTGPRHGVSEMPEVPWYDEGYIFPV